MALVFRGGAWPSAPASIIPAERLATVNWQNAGLRSIGGIPSANWTIFNPGGLAGNGVGGADQSSAIQTLLNNAGAAAGPGNGQVVLLQGSVSNTGVGGFHCNTPLNIPNYVVLRGAGPDSTEVHKSNGSGNRGAGTIAGTNGIKTEGSSAVTDVRPHIYIGAADPYLAYGDTPPFWDITAGNPGLHVINFATDGVQGTYSVTLANVTGLSVGQIVLIDELAMGGWIASSGGYRPTDTVWASDRFLWPCHNPASAGWGDDTNTTAFGNGGGVGVHGPYNNNQSDRLVDNFSYFCRYDGNIPSSIPQDVRVCSEHKEIASIVGNVVTFTSPFTITYRVGHAAQLVTYPTSVNAGSIDYTPSKYAGVEGIKFTNGGEGSIKMHGAYCWVKNVEITLWGGDTQADAISLNGCFRCEVRDSYVHTCTFPEPANGAYCICLEFGASDCLVENNICLDADKLLQCKGAGAGSVFGYNYCDNQLIGSGAGFVETALDSTHNAGAHHQLWEGNVASNAAMDLQFGSAAYITWFRNWLTGQRRDIIDQGAQRVVELRYGAWWHSFVGNVLGCPSRPSWQWSGNGFTGTTAGQGWVLTDPAMQCDAQGGSCAGKSLAWQDFDIYRVGYFENQNAYPDPLALSSLWRDGNYDYVTNSLIWNNTLATFTIPNSMYLGSKPSFFLSSDPWPYADSQNPSSTVSGANPALRRYNAGTPNVVP